MKLTCIETEAGYRYWVSPDACIAMAYDPYRQKWTQPDSAQFSGEWRLMGFAPLLRFGGIGDLQPGSEILGQNMRYKNGRGRYVAIDMDHGTLRQWSDRVVRYFAVRGEV